MKKTARFIVITFAAIIVVLLAGLFFVPAKKVSSPTISGAGQEIETSPDKTISVASPKMNAIIVSPIVASGTAKGNWFFEATFPIKILDGDGTVLGQDQARAEADWTTMGDVPFSATFSFSAPRYATGTIVFSKDNPSGLPQYAESFSVSVRFR